MSGTAERTDPKLWGQVKKAVTAGDKGGEPGQWSARKAQLAVQAYKRGGGGYKGRKSKDNHLVQWTEEEWGTQSGKASGETGERYLPEKARLSLSKAEYERTTRKKRADTRKGKQFSAQPKDIAAKTAAHRAPGSNGHSGPPSRAVLYRQAQAHKIRGRSTMTRDQLAKALEAVR